jgi:hypothetical protein
MTVHEYKVKPLKAKGYLDKAIKRSGIPTEYKKDWGKLSKEIDKLYKD